MGRDGELGERQEEWAAPGSLVTGTSGVAIYCYRLWEACSLQAAYEYLGFFFCVCMWCILHFYNFNFYNTGCWP